MGKLGLGNFCDVGQYKPKKLSKGQKLFCDFSDLDEIKPKNVYAQQLWKHMTRMGPWDWNRAWHRQGRVGRGIYTFAL